jgi:hypothetical protein
MSEELKEQIKEVREDVKMYADLESVKSSNGGKRILKGLGGDIVLAIDKLCQSYQKASHIELIALIAGLDERLGIFRTLNRSSKNKAMAKEELEELLKKDTEE